MNIDTQICIRDALDKGGEMKAIAQMYGVPFATVRKAAAAGWPEIPSLPHGGSGESDTGESPASSPPSPPPATDTNAKTMAALAAVQAEHNPKLLLRETARIIHLHLLRQAVKGEIRMNELVAAGKLLKDLLYIQQNTGAAKEEDLKTIDRLQQICESGDPQQVYDFYIEQATLYQGVTNPDVVAAADPEPEAEA